MTTRRNRTVLAAAAVFAIAWCIARTVNAALGAT